MTTDYLRLEQEYDKAERHNTAVEDTSKAVMVRASDVIPEPVDWLWHHRIPRGKVTGVIGDPGLGKSTGLLDLAARISTGGTMPDGAPVEPGGVVILSAEDGAADTIVPRLTAAGADLDRNALLTAVRTDTGTDELVLPDHIDALREAVASVNAVLVIVDPLNAYLTDKRNSFKDHDMRRALRPVASFAEDTGVAVVVVRHVTKSERRKAIHAAGGSIGITGAARAEFLVAEDPDDDTRRVFASVKNNLAPTPPSLSFRLESAAVDSPKGLCSVARVRWLGESKLTADELVSTTDPDERSALEDAKAFLRAQIGAGGERLAEDVMQEARRIGYAEKTLRRAKSALKIKSTRRGFQGPVYWTLPE
jgi:hypothetical protein